MGRIDWLPIAELPEAFKDGRWLLVWRDGRPYVTGWTPEYGSPTHFAEINPPDASEMDEYYWLYARLWDKLPWFVVGAAVVVTAPIMWWYIAEHSDSLGFVVFSGICALGSVVGGLMVAYPWIETDRAITRWRRKRHAALKDQETAVEVR